MADCGEAGVGGSHFGRDFTASRSLVVGRDLHLTVPSLSPQDLNILSQRILDLVSGSVEPSIIGGPQNTTLFTVEGRPVVVLSREQGLALARQSAANVESYLVGLLAHQDFGPWDTRYVKLVGTTVSPEIPASWTGNVPIELTVLQDLAELPSRRVQRVRIADVAKALESYTQMVLLGQPGAGKTTVCQKITLTAARAWLDDRSSPIPLYVRLGGYRSDQSPLSYLSDLWQARLGSNLIEVLRRGQVLLVLDGLNEMPQKDYVQRVDAWRAFARDWPEVQIVFSCRSHDYISLDIQRIEINRLDDEQIQQLIRNYVSVQADSLWNELSKKHGGTLIELARNPFMLVILAWLHATGDAALTPVRGELIYQLVRSLLARESLRGHEAIDTATLSDFLGQAAWDLVESGDSSTFPVDSLLRHRRSRSGQRTMPGAKIDDTAAIRLACSASILEETTEGAFRFCHHVIQDYFTGAEMAKRFAAGQDLTGLWRLAASTVQAREASQGNSLAFERLSAGPWDEATIMASGLCGDIEEFLSAVNISNPILAGRCQLESNADISQQLRDEINRRLLATMVDSGQELPTRVLAGETVGLLGDPRFMVSTAANGVHYIKPPMVQVPGGQYLVGASPEDTDAFDNERPQHSVSAQPFAIGKYLVTVGEFSHFVEAGGYAERRYWATEEARAWLDGTEADTGALSQLMEFREEVLQSGKSVEDWATEWSRSPQWLSTWRRLTEMDADRARATLLEVYAEHSRKEPIWWSEPSISGGNQPVVGITWYEAEAYCSWLSDVAGGNYRLPTEIEWEVAARGESCPVYPWGDSFDHRLANTIEGGVPTTTPVGLYADGASPFGLFDLAGNSWEWTGSPHRQYPARLGDRISIQPGERRAVRGGCWYSNKRYARCSYRSGDHPDCSSTSLAFECARTPSRSKPQ